MHWGGRMVWHFVWGSGHRVVGGRTWIHFSLAVRLLWEGLSEESHIHSPVPVLAPAQ
jgi:hypothetical protein